MLQHHLLIAALDVGFLRSCALGKVPTAAVGAPLGPACSSEIASSALSAVAPFSEGGLGPESSWTPTPAFSSCITLGHIIAV